MGRFRIEIEIDFTGTGDPAYHLRQQVARLGSRGTVNACRVVTSTIRPAPSDLEAQPDEQTRPPKPAQEDQTHAHPPEDGP